MSKIAGEINAEMMHPKVIHEQRKALFAEMVGKTGSKQSVLDRLIQEIESLRQQLATSEKQIVMLCETLEKVAIQEDIFWAREITTFAIAHDHEENENGN